MCALGNAAVGHHFRSFRLHVSAIDLVRHFRVTETDHHRPPPTATVAFFHHHVTHLTAVESRWNNVTFQSTERADSAHVCFDLKETNERGGKMEASWSRLTKGLKNWNWRVYRKSKNNLPVFKILTSYNWTHIWHEKNGLFQKRRKGVTTGQSESSMTEVWSS